MTDKITKTKREIIRKKRLGGVVVSDKMDKTVVVKVSTLKKHKKYKKRYKFSKTYKAHDELNHFKEGDTVEIVECRPLSRDKRWRVIYGAGVKKSETKKEKGNKEK